MQPVGFYCSEPQYLDHVAPIWHALEPEERAWFATGSQQAFHRGQEHDVDIVLDRKAKRLAASRVVVAAYNDLRTFARRRVVFVEHGAGQTYAIGEAGHPHYSGGRGRGNVDLFLNPNRTVATANLYAYPNTPSIVVGSPRLDRWAGIEPPRPHNGNPTVAVSFHFDARINAPEARWAFPHFMGAVANLRQNLGWEILGHGHPRALASLKSFYDQNQIEIVPTFDEVCERANVYVCDNSSTIFEFAALGRPVVLLNAPWYRRDVQQGVRFWEYADIGFNVDHPKDLPAAIRQAWADPPDYRRRRETVSAALFGPLDGHSADRAAQAMRGHLP